MLDDSVSIYPFGTIALNEKYSLINGVFSVGGSVSRIVIRKTVIERSAEIPRVTFSPDSDGT